MKVIKFKKKKKVEDTEESSSLYGKNKEQQGIVSWAVTDSSKFKALSKQAKFQGRRAPEVWLKDGESRLLRFLDEDAVLSFMAYRFKVNGKWERFIKPAEGKTDLFASSLGLRPSRMFVYRVIDIDGYTDKKGKKLGNLPRFYVIGARLYDQVKMMAEEQSDVGNLPDYNVKVTRSGTSTSTTYQFFPKRVEPMTPEMKKAAANFPNWQEYYRPLSSSEQQAVVTFIGGGMPSDEDET